MFKFKDKKKANRIIIGLMLVAVFVYVADFVLLPQILNQTKIAIKAGTPKKYDSIVRLTRQGRTFCTGTVIAPNLIVTAAHCVLMEGPFGGSMLNDYDIEIRPESNVKTGAAAHAIYVTQQMDQAILTGDFSLFSTRPIITSPEILSAVKKGDEFLACGYPLNGALFCTTLVYQQRDNFFWASRGVLIPGMSGGPTMRADGAVMCVNTAVERDLSIASPLYNILANIEGAK